MLFSILHSRLQDRKEILTYRRFEPYCFILDGQALKLVWLCTILTITLCRGTYTNKSNNDRFFNLEYVLALVILCIFPEFDGWKGLAHLVIPVSLIMLVNFNYSKRWDLDWMDADLLDLVDNYYISTLQSYQVYREAIKLLERQGIKISNIACFVADTNYNKLHLINSSSLIFRFE